MYKLCVSLLTIVVMIKARERDKPVSIPAFSDSSRSAC